MDYTAITASVTATIIAVATGVFAIYHARIEVEKMKLKADVDDLVSLKSRVQTLEVEVDKCHHERLHLMLLLAKHGIKYE